MKQGHDLVRMPVINVTTAGPDGSFRTFTATDPKYLVAGSAVVAAGHRLMWESIRAGILATGGDAAPPLSEGQQDAVNLEGERRLLRTHARLMTEILALPLSPPKPSSGA